MTSTQEPSDIVRHGYDRVGDMYTAAARTELTPGRRHALALIEELVPAGGRILDAGCGAGVPMTAALAQRCQVHGVDVSQAQVERARQNVPTATFECADIVDLVVSPASYDAVVAFYSLIHVPRDSHGLVLERIRTWLRPGGLFVACFGVGDDPGTVQDDWLGSPMFFSHFDSGTTIELVTTAGFDIVSASVIDEPEDEGAVSFLWVVARSRA